MPGTVFLDFHSFLFHFDIVILYFLPARLASASLVSLLTTAPIAFRKSTVLFFFFVNVLFRNDVATWLVPTIAAGVLFFLLICTMTVTCRRISQVQQQEKSLADSLKRAQTKDVIHYFRSIHHYFREICRHHQCC